MGKFLMSKESQPWWLMLVIQLIQFLINFFSNNPV